MNDNTIQSPVFLEQVAEQLMQLLDGDLSNTVVVFPNKRASLFFNIYLARYADKNNPNGDMVDNPNHNGNPIRSAIWSPRYLTIDQLFTSLTTLDIVDPIYAVCLLYQSYISQTGKDESLDKFYGWGEMMIADFDDIDKNMVDARLLFENIKDLDELTTLDYLTQEQKNAIVRFFQEFRTSEDETKLKKEFITIWKSMHAIYSDFHERLLQEKKAYTGMLYRWVVDTIEASPTDNPCLERMRAANYVFVGFNVLTKAEERLLRYIKQNKNAYFFWDYDEAYMPQKGWVDNGKDLQPGVSDLFEAGKYIYRNIQKFGNDLSSSGTLTNLRNPKTINYISASTEDMQSRYASEWVNTVYTEKVEDIRRNAQTEKDIAEKVSAIDFTRTAVVLCNESSLQSVMDAMPPVIGDTQYALPVNITMGYPLKETPVSSLIEALLNLQSNGYAGNGVWKFHYVSTVLNHPYCLMMSGENIPDIMADLKDHNIMYPREDRLKKDDFLRLVFTPKSDNTLHLLDYLLQIVRTIASVFSQQKNERISQYQLYAESLFCTHSILSRLVSIHDTGILDVQLHTLCRLVRQLIASKSIPFHGEPAEGVQVMGMLETRCLDFSDIIILSATEDMLPKKHKASSFIPYSLREAYGLTTIDEEVSLYAYYFFRLLQRANNITLLYNTSTEGMSSGEMSRFLLQMLVDKDQFFAPGQKIGRYSLTTDVAVTFPKVASIPKNESIMLILRHKYESWRQKEDRMRYFSPTAVNTYLECPMKFYYKYVAGLYPEEEVTEDVDTAAFGSIFHKCMEDIYKPFVDRGDIQATTLDNIAKDREKIHRYVDAAFKEIFFKGVDVRYNGEQLLNREVISTYVVNQLRYDMRLCPMRILGVEKKCQIELEVKVHGEAPLKLFVGGIIDRYDEVTVDGTRYRRIVDYKTSNSVCKYSGLDALFTPGEDKDNAHHIRQAFYYADVMMQQEPGITELYPTLMYVKLPNQCTPTIEYKKEKGKEKEPAVKAEFCGIRDDYHQRLVSTLEEVYNKDVPFTQCNEGKSCTYCDLKELCNR